MRRRIPNPLARARGADQGRGGGDHPRVGQHGEHGRRAAATGLAGDALARAVQRPSARGRGVVERICSTKNGWCVRRRRASSTTASRTTGGAGEHLRVQRGRRVQADAHADVGALHAELAPPRCRPPSRRPACCRRSTSSTRLSPATSPRTSTTSTGSRRRASTCTRTRTSSSSVARRGGDQAPDPQGRAQEEEVAARRRAQRGEATQEGEKGAEEEVPDGGGDAWDRREAGGEREDRAGVRGVCRRAARAQ